MVVIDELQADWAYLERDPLIGRLRALKWADVPGGVRDRCWERVNMKVAQAWRRRPGYSALGHV